MRSTAYLPLLRWLRRTRHSRTRKTRQPIPTQVRFYCDACFSKSVSTWRKFSIRAAPCAPHHPQFPTHSPKPCKLRLRPRRKFVDAMYRRSQLREYQTSNCGHHASLARAADGADVGRRRVPAEITSMFILPDRSPRRREPTSTLEPGRSLLS